METKDLQNDIELSMNRKRYQSMDLGEAGPAAPRPRCLATLPSNFT